MIECWGRRFSDFLCPPPLRIVGEMRRGSSPLYFPVIDQPSALTSQRTDGVLQLRFECCFVLKSITRDKESSAKNRVFSARIAHQIIFRTHIKRAWFSRKPPVKKGMHGIWMGKKSERALLKVEIPQAPWVSPWVPHRQGASDIGSHIGHRMMCLLLT